MSAKYQLFHPSLKVIYSTGTLLQDSYKQSLKILNDFWMKFQDKNPR